MTAITKPSMNESAYRQLMALRKNSRSADRCVEKVTDSLMEEFNCSRRRAAMLAVSVWADLEQAGRPSAYIDVSHTTGNTVVIHDTGTGRTSVFSIRELLQLRDSTSTIAHIQA